LEQRIAEEKDKNSRKLANIQEDLEMRMREEMAEKDEEIECL
jgi:polyhydroxyalkanoate synthesis regulator phasin